MLLRSAKPSFFQKLYVTSKWHTTGKVLPTKLSLYVTVPYCSSLHLSTSHCFCRLSRRCLTAYIYHISMLFHLSAHLSTHLIYTQYPLYFKKHDPIHLHNPIWTITLHRLFNLVLSCLVSSLILIFKVDLIQYPICNDLCRFQCLPSNFHGLVPPVAEGFGPLQPLWHQFAPLLDVQTWSFQAGASRLAFLWQMHNDYRSVNIRTAQRSFVGVTLGVLRPCIADLVSKTSPCL